MMRRSRIIGLAGIAVLWFAASVAVAEGCQSLGDSGKDQEISVSPMSASDDPPPAIRIVNPPANRDAVSYTLNGFAFTIRPGEKQDLQGDRRWVIDFDRGGQFGKASYGLYPGVFTFTPSQRGWELYHGPWPTFREGPTPIVPPSPMSSTNTTVEPGPGPNGDEAAIPPSLPSADTQPPSGSWL